MANGRGLAGLATALIVGVVIGAGGMRIIDRKHAGPWIEAGAAWQTLPGHIPAGALPQTFATPARAYDYGATTLALNPTIGAAGPVIVKIDLGSVSGGKVGLSLDKPDGSALVSKERPLEAKDSGASAYFRYSASQGPVALLLRNYGDEGRPGSVEVKAVTYAPESGLDAAAMGVVNKAGVY